MAEYMFRDLLKKKGFSGATVFSRGTSDEEEGNPVHYGTKAVLDKLGIDSSSHRARRITKKECDEADLIVCMDQYNVWRVKKICDEKDHPKIAKLLDFTSRYGDIDDPWYTHDFSRCYKDINEGLKGLYEHIKRM